jgi:hypothetical protein
VEDTKRWAQRFAEAGYAALAVDLFTGRNRTVCMFSMMRGLLFDSLDHRGIRDLKATLNFLEEQPSVDRERVGAVGYCLGGSLAIAWACTDLSGDSGVRCRHLVSPYAMIAGKGQKVFLNKGYSSFLLRNTETPYGSSRLVLGWLALSRLPPACCPVPVCPALRERCASHGKLREV